jgi:hypothetical protein
MAWQPLPVLTCQVVPAEVAFLVGCSRGTTMFLFNDVPNRLACPEVKKNLGQRGACSRRAMSGKQTRTIRYEIDGFPRNSCSLMLRSEKELFPLCLFTRRNTPAACSTLRTLVGVFNLWASQHARQTMKILSFL